MVAFREDERENDDHSFQNPLVELFHESMSRIQCN